MKKADIKEIISLFSDTKNLGKMKLKYDDLHMELEKTTSQVLAQAPVISTPPLQVQENSENPLPPKAETQKSNCITSPMVGTFYKAPSPGSAPFAKAGDVISKGQTVAIVEAMKIMNEIEAEYNCKIVKILVEDGQPVEFDMPLYEVEKL